MTRTPARHAVAVAALVLAAPAAGQQAPTHLPPVRAADAAVAARPAAPARRASTLLERFGWGAVTALIATTATYHAMGRDMPDGVRFLSYGGGSALGVGLVTHAREGMNARGILLGTAAGTGAGIGVMALAGAFEERESPSADQWLAVIFYLAAVPLGAALGHRQF